MKMKDDLMFGRRFLELPARRRRLARGLAACLCAVFVTGCADISGNSRISPDGRGTAAAVALPAEKGYAFQYEADPEVFSLSLTVAGGDERPATVQAAAAGPGRTVEQYTVKGEETSWLYPEDKVSISIKPVDDYLSVEITSKTEEDNSFTWPEISADSYYFPFGEGKRIPAADAVWREYLSGQSFSALERLSMPFWAAESGEYAVLFIMEEPFRTTLNFHGDQTVSFSVQRDYPSIDQEKTSRFRIYLTENDPVCAAKLYRKYVEENGGLVTLEQKAKDQPAIRKLYGAPFIYLWGERVISPEDIDWKAFRESIDSPVMDYMKEFGGKEGPSGQTGPPEGGGEFRKVLSEIRDQDYVGEYQKGVVCNYLSLLLRRPDFYNPKVWENFFAEDLSVKNDQEWEYESVNESAVIQVNKKALAASLPRVFRDVDRWMERDTTGLVDQLQSAGVSRAWIGLNSWEQAYAKPELVSAAADAGYLIGSYDSYHSIHEPGKEQWITAKFPDSSLYEQAAVSGEDGEKIEGFQGVGRKLNPTLSLPAAKERMEEIMDNDLPFNSWFIDCDATGEIYDDYTPEHITTQRQDLNARLERMAYIRDAYDLVIGSEGGNDLAAKVIAFAHGIELQSFAWMDEEMKADKDSEYYIGRYYNPSGGVAEHFSKRVPVKDRYDALFLNPKYDAPLYRLVYNDSVITSYHWDWSTFKIKGRTKTRMAREILYNIPPLFHLDGAEWEEYQDDIVRHTAVWSEFSQKAVLHEMTDFAYLSDDGLVQMTEYGKGLRAVANFSDESVSFEERTIPGGSVLMDMDGDVTIYTPEAAPEHS